MRQKCFRLRGQGLREGGREGYLVCLVVRVGEDVAVSDDGKEGKGGILSDGDALEVIPVGLLGVTKTRKGGREGGGEGGDGRE